MRDPFGRPIIIVQLSGVWNSGEDLKASIYHNIELMRQHLVRLNSREPAASPILQYLALLDIQGLAFNGVVSTLLDINGRISHLIRQYAAKCAITQLVRS